MKSLLLGLMFVSSFTFALGDLPTFPHISVKGESTIQAEPTKAKISFTIMEFDADPQAAQNVVQNRLVAVIASAAKYNIAKDNIQLQSLQKIVKRKTDANYNQLQILGYEITQQVTVTVNNIGDYPKFADELVTARNVNSIYTVFDVTDRSAMVDSLIKSATKDAKEKAKKLANGMDVSLGEVFAISQETDYTKQLSKPAIYNLQREVAAPSDVSGGYSIVPKYIELSASVSAIFKIKP